MSMLQHVPDELRPVFCAATHTAPTPAEAREQDIASAIAEERLTVAVLQSKLHDVADFAAQLYLSLPSGGPDMTQLIDDIDACRAEMRLLMREHGGADAGRDRAGTTPDALQVLRDMVRIFRHPRRSEFASDQAHREAVDCELRARAVLFKATGEGL